MMEKDEERCRKMDGEGRRERRGCAEIRHGGCVA